MGALHCYLQRAHGVLDRCLTWMEIYFTVQTLNSFDISGCLRARLSTKQPSLYFFFTNGMRVICIIGEENRICFNCSADTFCVLLCMKCAACVFKFHTLRATTQIGAFKCDLKWPGQLRMLYL